MPVRLSILIPVYNEAGSIKTVLQRVVLSAEGAGIRTAIAHAQGEFCLLQDTDCEFDPGEYPKLLAPLLSGDADVVLGSRVHEKRGTPVNRTMNALIGMASGVKVSDAMSGFQVFRTALGQSVALRGNGYGLAPELIVQFAKRHARFVEVPISPRERGTPIGTWTVCIAFGNVLRAWLLGAGHTNAAADMLVAISQANRFNRWMADTVKPWIEGDVLELGAGIGNLTVLLSASGNSYTATDIDPEHLSELRSRTACRANVKTTTCDFSSANDIEKFRQTADTVICVNALEHVADDVAALANVRCCLRPGGTAIVLVPQSQELFGSLDEVLEHKRRYTKKELGWKMEAAGFRLKETIEFNRATWPGWYLNSRLLRKRTLSRVQLRLFDLLVPLWRRIDHRLPWPGTSLIAIGVAVP